MEPPYSSRIGRERERMVAPLSRSAHQIPKARSVYRCLSIVREDDPLRVCQDRYEVMASAISSGVDGAGIAERPRAVGVGAAMIVGGAIGVVVGIVARR